MTSSKEDHKKHITWDESGILEQDKERGTRMKIYEVSTPFIYTTSDLESDDGSLETEDIAKELISRLNVVKCESDRKAAFLEHRKKHYDEFKTLKALKQDGKLKPEEDITYSTTDNKQNS
ncbi:Protein phosphatase inhibitor 2 (IPP-2) [Babesia duncani]|uniref:Protein phosphatase inhibitor 2 (IPP-2) n=1 Tax=Babesia duncani TaxID=323732 RepID=A0AAD9PHV8_9APIC|nr:Protein phosphatase inhibitor 2 (IPP-2) [Babesia duncani]KAK2194974.1 Protein phosphatase inhibitor 2 (IPP-2) [Babesia duncani]